MQKESKIKISVIRPGNSNEDFMEQRDDRSIEDLSTAGTEVRRDPPLLGCRSRSLSYRILYNTTVDHQNDSNVVENPPRKTRQGGEELSKNIDNG